MCVCSKQHNSISRQQNFHQRLQNYFAGKRWRRWTGDFLDCHFSENLTSYPALAPANKVRTWSASGPCSYKSRWWRCSPIGLLWTNVAIETAFRHDHCKHFQNSKHLLGSKVSWCNHRLAQTPEEAFSEVRVHAGTTQVDFEVDRPPPADSPPGDLLITMVKETVIIYNKEFWKNEKKVKLVRISHWSDSNENAIDCEIACDCVKRANVVVGLRKKKIRQDTQLPTSQHLLSAL